MYDFLRIPSVSAKSEHNGDTRAPPSGFATASADAGLEPAIHDTPGHPVVLGEWRGAGDDAPTVLIYGHYDVQPPEPLDEWESPPFEPTERDGKVFARGSADDKGQLYMHVKALEAHLKANGSLPRERHRPGRGRGGGRLGEPGALREAERGAAGLRPRRHLRLQHVRRGHALGALLPAGAGLLRDPREGRPLRPPLRPVRRARGEPGQRPGEDPRLLPRRRRPDRHRRLLRRRGWTGTRRPGSRSGPCPSTRRRTGRSWRCRRLGGEKGYSHPGAPLDPAHLRRERAPVRLHRRGRQDGAPRTRPWPR